MLKTCSGEIESSQESQILSLAKKWNLPKRFQNEDDDVIKKHPKFPTRQDLKDTGYDWLESTELAIDKRKSLLSRLFLKQPIPQDEE